MVFHKFLKKRFCRLFYSLNINACHCLSALGGAVRAHTHIVCYTLYHRTKQWRSTLSNSTTPALWMKNAQYTAHSALRHRPKAQICRNYPRGPTPQKLPPENRWQKKESKGPWFEGLKRIFQQKYDRWGLCETCVAQAKVLGPMWLMAKVDTLYVFTYDFLSLSLRLNWLFLWQFSNL